MANPYNIQVGDIYKHEYSDIEGHLKFGQVCAVYNDRFDIKFFNKLSEVENYGKAATGFSLETGKGTVNLLLDVKYDNKLQPIVNVSNINKENIWSL